MRSRLARCDICVFLLILPGLTGSHLAAQSIRLNLDLTEAPRNIYQAHLNIPAKGGEMALVFPEWIPGNHRPSGPIGALIGIRMQSHGQPLAWQRDPIDMYAFPVNVPAGVSENRGFARCHHLQRQRRCGRAGGILEFSRLELERCRSVSARRELGCRGIYAFRDIACGMGLWNRAAGSTRRWQ